MSQRKSSIAKELPKRFANTKYQLACAEPLPWLFKARELRRCADLVWNQYSSELKAFTTDGKDNGEPFTGSVSMMLYGFTLENLLKAGLAAKGLGVLPNGNFALKSHALEDYADKLALDLSLAERELLERLEHFVEWAGRYPIPLYAETLYPRVMVDGSRAALYGISSSDHTQIESLILRLEAQLPTEEQALESYVRNCSA